jgi:hypothetical protein
MKRRCTFQFYLTLLDTYVTDPQERVELVALQQMIPPRIPGLARQARMSR